MNTKARIAKAEREHKTQKNAGGKLYVIHADGDNFMTGDGVMLSLAEFEKLKGDNIKIVRVGIDLDKL